MGLLRFKGGGSGSLEGSYRSYMGGPQLPHCTLM